MSLVLRDVSRTRPLSAKAIARSPSHFISYAHPVSSEGNVPVVASIGRSSVGGDCLPFSVTPRSLPVGSLAIRPTRPKTRDRHVSGTPGWAHPRQVSVMSPERPIQKQRRTVPAQLGLLEPSAGAFQTGLSVPGLHED